MDESDIKKLASAYVGVVDKPGMAYKIQEEFIQQGYFSVKATEMGANLVLLESLEEGEMEALIEGAQDWLSTWFSDLRKWNPNEVDDEYLTWVKCYGIPIHAWGEDFFKFIISGTGEFVAIDDNTERRKSLDVARILIRRKRFDVINFVERFEINGEIFVIKVIEDWFATQRSNWNRQSESSSSSSSESESMHLV